MATGIGRHRTLGSRHCARGCDWLHRCDRRGGPVGNAPARRRPKGPSAPTRRASTRTRSRRSPPSSRSPRSTARCCRSIPTATRTSSATWPASGRSPGRAHVHVQDPSGHPVPRRLAADVRRRQGQLRQDHLPARRSSQHSPAPLFGGASVEAPDPSTVVFKLKFPSASLFTNLAHPMNVIFPKKLLDKDPN